MPHDPTAWTRIGSFASPSFSKDGTRLLHLRGAGLPQLWSMALDGSDARQLTFFDEKVATVRRSPTDERIIVGIDAGGDECQQFHLISADGGITPLTAAPLVMHSFGAWSPDGTRIAYTANDHDPAHFDLLVMELATGAVTQLRAGENQTSISGWSNAREQDRIAFIQDYSSSDQRLHVIDLATGACHLVPAPGPTRYASVRWTADGALMALTDHGGSDMMQLCRIDPDNGGAAVVHAAPGREIDAWAQAPNRGKLAVVENDRGYSVLKIDGTIVEDLPNGTVSDLNWSPDGETLAFIAQSPTSPPAIWLWQNGQARRLLGPDPQAEAGISADSFADYTLVQWTAEDGLAIPGWLAMPKTPAPAGGHPAIIWVHGGPVGQSRPNFRADFQMLIDQGYALLLPNVRGSSGYGRAAMESDDVELRPAALADLAAGRNWLASQPHINPSKIGVMGQSYGGWMVLGAITLYPDLWKAAVDYYGIADFTTLLNRTSSYRRSHRAREYGFPETHQELFEKISPIHHIDRVTAPLLVAHGERDPRVPKHESDQFVKGLEERQKKVRYVEFTYAGHGFIRPADRERIFSEVATHFGTFLRG